MKYGREDYEGEGAEKKIPDEEPVFLLRGQDQCSAAAVRYWAALNELHGGDPEASRRAREQAELMELWPVNKVADV